MSNLISIKEYLELAKNGRVGKKRNVYNAKFHMENVLNKIVGINCWDKEYLFSLRKFRFDYALDAAKIAIEYEGLMSEKSGHTTITGYTSNCEKYNLACILGWKVLRYTALNYKQLENDLKELLK